MCLRATEFMHHSYYSPRDLEPVLRNKRSHCNEKPEYHNQRKSTHSKEELAHQ